jgi:GNAT superfamily N-acetyltransferase
VYVDPLSARRGVGSMLVRELERSAIAAGIESLRLDSSVTAEGFYQRHGFGGFGGGSGGGGGREIHDCGNGTRLECVRMTKSLRLLPPREATAADVPAIFQIRTTVHENAITMQRLADVGISPDSVVESLGKSRRGWVIGNGAGAVVAFAMMDVETDTVLGLFTHPGWQGRGCGSTLLRQAAQFLFDRGAKRVTLTTGGDTPAAEFYRRRGWKVDGEVAPGELRFVLDRP